MADPVDYSDPCATADYLRSVRMSIIEGRRAVRVVHQTAGGSRKEVEYGPANLAALDRAISEAADACAIAQGGKRRRFALIPRQ
jgi:hypothetical protein